MKRNENVTFYVCPACGNRRTLRQGVPCSQCWEAMWSEFQRDNPPQPLSPDEPAKPSDVTARWEQGRGRVR